MRTNPNQKIITVNKEKCDRNNLYIATNLNALQLAAQDLKAGAFKLWVYFSQNQNGYSFALSNKDANDSFGIKKDQYDSAIKELEAKGYLVKENGNKWIFFETPKNVVGKNHNENLGVVKTHNENISLQEKTITQKWEKTTTGCGKKPQEIIQYNTIYNTDKTVNPSQGDLDWVPGYSKPDAKERLIADFSNNGTKNKPIPLNKEILEKYNIAYNDLVPFGNLYYFQGLWFKIEK